MSFSFFSNPLGGKLNDAYPSHIQSWANRLKSSVETDDLADLKKKYENTPLRRTTAKPSPAKKPKKRR